MSVCVVMCRQVVYVSTGSKKIVLLSVSVSTCVGRLFFCVDICRYVSSEFLCGCNAWGGRGEEGGGGEGGGVGEGEEGEGLEGKNLIG